MLFNQHIQYDVLTLSLKIHVLKHYMFSVIKHMSLNVSLLLLFIVNLRYLVM